MPFRDSDPTFAGGEVAPEIQSRFDTSKYRTAVRKGRNVLSLVEGGMYKRPGTEFCGEIWDMSQPVFTVPFQFSVTQSYVLELGAGYMRVVSDGGYVLDPLLTIQNITNAYPAQVQCTAHGWAVGDDVYFQDVSGMTQINGLLGRVLSVIDANNVTIGIDTTTFGVFSGDSGGIVGNSLGGVGGLPGTPPPTPTFAQTTTPPATFNFNFGTISIGNIRA